MKFCRFPITRTIVVGLWALLCTAPALTQAPATRLFFLDIRGGRIVSSAPDGSDVRASRELARAHEAYRRGDFAAASHGFGLVAKLRQDDPLVHLYLGISELHRRRFSEAVLELSTAQRLAGRDRTISSEAAWHLGYVFHRNGERERAIATFEDLCRGTTVRSALGCAAALELSKGAQEARR